jgi:hypothetical protein
VTREITENRVNQRTVPQISCARVAQSPERNVPQKLLLLGGVILGSAIHGRNHMPANVEEVERLVEESSIILKATVSRLSHSNEPAFPSGDRSVLAQVDGVFRSGSALGNLVGRSVTIELLPGHRPKVGDQEIFFANGLLYGAQIALREVGHLDPGAKVEKDVVAAIDALPARHVGLRLAGAELVVGGTVARIRPSGIKEAVSFHSPKWMVAVIRVSSALKGKAGDDEVEVVFPSSHDQRWSLCPKFHDKQEGIFILRRGATTDWGLPAHAYTALDHADFQPSDAKARIQALLSHKE